MRVPSKASAQSDSACTDSGSPGAASGAGYGSGAIARTLDRILRDLGRLASLKTTHDSTVYGTSRASPRDFYAHHSAAISAAIVYADAESVLNAAAHLSFSLSLGL